MTLDQHSKPMRNIRLSRFLIAWALFAMIAVCAGYGVYSCDRYNRRVSFEHVYRLDTKGVARKIDSKLRGQISFRIVEPDGDIVVAHWVPEANANLFRYIMDGDTVEFRGKRDLAVVTRVRGTVVRSDTFRMFAD